MSAAEYRKRPAKPVNKYSAEQVVADGMLFASKIEHRRYRYLRMRELAGEISGLEVHPEYVLVGRSGMILGKFTPDFRYWGEDGNLRVEDVKGQTARLEAYRLRCKLLWDQEGIMVTTVTERERDWWEEQDSFRLPTTVRRSGRKRRKRAES